MSNAPHPTGGPPAPRAQSLLSGAARVVAAAALTHLAAGAFQHVSRAAYPWTVPQAGGGAIPPAQTVVERFPPPAGFERVPVEPGSFAAGPWYPAEFGAELRTPEWTFARGARRRFD